MKTDPFVHGQSKGTLEIPLESFPRSPPTRQESKAKITSDTDQAVNALNGRIVAWNVGSWKTPVPAFLDGAKQGTVIIAGNLPENPSGCYIHDSNMKTICF